MVYNIGLSLRLVEQQQVRIRLVQKNLVPVRVVDQVGLAAGQVAGGWQSGSQVWCENQAAARFLGLDLGSWARNVTAGHGGWMHGSICELKSAMTASFAGQTVR